MLTHLEYTIPETLDEAVAALSGPGAHALAGGSDLILAIREKQVWPRCLVDLGQIPALRGITRDPEWLRIGAMATFANLAGDVRIRAEAPALAGAAASVGSPQIRNTATLGGNIMNRAPAADSLPALLVLDAVLVLAGPAGERRIPLAAFLEAEAPPDDATTELLVRIEIPCREGRRMAFAKIGRRQAMAIARINVALAGSMDPGGAFVECAVALGAVGKTAYRAREIEAFLAGRRPGEETIREAGEQIARQVRERLGSRPTAAYKAQIASACLVRALREIREGTKGESPWQS